MNKFHMKRRHFLSALALGTAHVMFENPLYGKTPRFSSTDPLQKVALGGSGLETSLIGFGTGVWAGNRSSFLTRQEKDKSIALLRHAYDRGMRMFDCADTYGTHGIMAEALQHMDRDKLMLTSKIWTRERGGIPESERPDADVVVERFRKELQVDYLDLVQIHCMVDGDWTDSQRRQMDILDNLKAKGVVKAHGVSVHSLEALEPVIDDPWIDVLHTRVNPYGVAMDSKDPEDVVKLVHKVHKSGKGIIGMKVAGNGDWKNDSEKIDKTIRFVMGLGSVDMVIVGFETEEQINDYMTRMEGGLSELI